MRTDEEIYEKMIQCPIIWKEKKHDMLMTEIQLFSSSNSSPEPPRRFLSNNEASPNTKATSPRYIKKPTEEFLKIKPVIPIKKLKSNGNSPSIVR